MGDHRTSPKSNASYKKSSQPQESLSISFPQNAIRLISGGPKSTSEAAHYVSPKASTKAMNQPPSKKSNEKSPEKLNVTPPMKSNSTGAAKQSTSRSAKRKYPFDFSGL